MTGLTVKYSATILIKKVFPKSNTRSILLIISFDLSSLNFQHPFSGLLENVSIVIVSLSYGWISNQIICLHALKSNLDFDSFSSFNAQCTSGQLSQWFNTRWNIRPDRIPIVFTAIIDDLQLGMGA